MSPIVRIADPRGSTPRPLSLVAVAVGAAVVGFLLLKLSLVAPRPDAALDPLADEAASAGMAEDSERAPETAEEVQAPSEDEPALVADAGEAVADAVLDAGAAVAPVAVAEEPVVDPAGGEAAGDGEAGAPPPAGERTLVHGRVAYFQCPNDQCPRDHGLERSVWRVLDRLGACLGDAGQADVRVSVQAGAVAEVRFRERGAEGIDIGVLNRCVTPPLMRINGSTLPDDAVVSFRFDLQ